MRLSRFLRDLHLAQLAALQKFGIKVVTDVAFANEPLQLTDAYDHLRLTHDSNGSDDDTWLEGQIPAAREYCEGVLGRSLATKTLELATNAFPTFTVDTEVGPCIDLRFGPVQSITSVTYLALVTDSNGVTVLDSNGEAVTQTKTLATTTYALDTYVTPNRLVLAYGKSWPTDAIGTLNSVKIRYITGYVATADSNGNAVLPRVARVAMLLLLGHFYENREASGLNTLVTLPLGVQSLLELVPNRENLGMA
jgi:uncharacterized phiE125 gp8 family phage protein